MRLLLRSGVFAAAIVLGCAGIAAAQPVKNRISILVDSSGSMLLTPQIITYTETCPGWDPCAVRATPALSTTCNACVINTVSNDSFCSMSQWDGTCRDAYSVCMRSVTGSQTCNGTMSVSDGITTRGDGSTDLPGCDLNGNNRADDSRMYQAKEALSNVIATFGEVEFSLWRYRQIIGGQACTADSQCPDTPGRPLDMPPVAPLSILTCEDLNSNGSVDTCAFDADMLDGATTAGFEGQCNRFTHTGAPDTFTCGACSRVGSFDQARCNFFDLDRVRTNATSLLNGTAVNCSTNPPNAGTNHRFMRYHGAVGNSGCDPTGSERLVDFPATGFLDNYPDIYSWIDHNQNPFSTADELRPQGGTPIAASLRDMRTSILATSQADTKTPCRKHQVIVLTDGGESCESVSAAEMAAASLQNLSFNNGATPSVFVPDYDVDVYVIGFAICSGCQTVTDLNAIAAAGGTGSAILVNNQLELQLALARIVADSVVAEVCNGDDDNCNGLIDEGFDGLGTACSEGTGTCLGTGTFVCTGDELGIECNATAGAPGTEVCNRLDDDCDGLIDDGLSCTGCVPVCSPAAGCDICNNIDEDCDTRFDENFAATDCGIDTGECNHGRTSCVAGIVGCTGATGPTIETCDNQDDDCDTAIDGMTEACYPPAGCPFGICLGICRPGTHTCIAGSFGVTCTGAVGPRTEIPCNLLDDDCDGLVDEGDPSEQCNGQDDDCDRRVDEGVAMTDAEIGDVCGTGPVIGECRQGAIQCVAGAEVCVGEVAPVAELCDRLDNDCDGPADEGTIPGFGGSCGSSIGECAPGLLRCVNGMPDCVGDVGPVQEVCNGDDDNCNNAIDETDPMLGDSCNMLTGGGTVATETGECSFGVLACSMGGLVCIGAVGPIAEICNGLDDDCDGTADEIFPVGGACDNGELGVCRQVGVWVCALDGTVVCTAPDGVPGIETCNGRDDDCDNMIDELPLPPVGTICAPAAGVCTPGLWQCVAGELVCGPPSSGNQEVCDARDNDCDALVDESPPGFPLPGDPNVPGEPDEDEQCVPPGFTDIGTCTPGLTVCVNGDIECIGYIGPQSEICDGYDNDCDGIDDDMAACPVATNACVEGQCVEPCGTGEFPCFAGYTCQDLTDVTPPGRYCVPDPCLDVTCGPNEACDPTTGMCRNLCENVMCDAGEECRLGFCLDCFTLPDRCTAAQLCIADSMDVGQCIDDPCAPGTCAPDQVCSNGVCSSACQGGCPDGQLCVSGGCEVDQCDRANCTAGQVCDPSSGQCVPSDCDGVRCNPSEICVATTGDCAPDPCLTSECQTGATCWVDGDGRAICGVPVNPNTDRVTAAGSGCHAGSGGASLWLLAASIVPLCRRRRRCRQGGAA